MLKMAYEQLQKSYINAFKRPPEVLWLNQPVERCDKMLFAATVQKRLANDVLHELYPDFAFRTLRAQLVHCFQPRRR